VREQRPDATAELVGRHDGSLGDLAALPGVHLVGAVDDVAAHYDAADVVVVPLRHGGGTRIKVIEAFAHRRPVVATPTAIAGLDAEPGQHVLVAESPDDLAQAVVDLLADPGRAAALVGQAFEFVASRYTRAVVGPLVRAAVLGANAGSAAA
jgi:glycosyltransferase involved in cell wall biosynthesis